MKPAAQETEKLSPIPAEALARPGEFEAERSGLPLGFYIALLQRYRWRIVTLVLASTALVTLASLALQKQYQSTAVLRIDPAGVRTVGELDNTTNGSAQNDSRLITTEAREVTSPAVVTQTIAKLHLASVLDFRPSPAPSGQALTQIQQNQVLARVSAGIGVDQPLDTYLLRVSFRAHDPNLAAQVANGLLESLIQQDAETRVRALNASTKAMRAQLSTLSAQMESSERELVDYESANDVLEPDSKTNLMQANLSQVGQDLVAARAKRMQLQAVYNIVEGGDLDALRASDSGRDLQPLYLRLLTDQRELVRMAQVYGVNYPLYRQQLNLVNNDQAQLQAGERHLASEIAAQYVGAAKYEQLLSTELERQKQNMDDFNRKAIQYYALKGRADSASKLYNQLQQQIQDAEVAANLQTESLRIISPAQPEPKPVYPRPLLAGVLTALVSALLGVGAAISVGILNRTLSKPEEIEQWFGIAPLASLPLVASRDHTSLAPSPFGARYLGAGDTQAPSTEELQPSHSSPFREGILALHSALLLAQDQECRVLAICSSLPGEGKSTVAANLAAAFAGLGSSTVLVDCDMRKPSMHRQFQISNRRGLSNLLRGQTGLEQVLTAAPGIPNLSLVPGGPPPAGPAELLRLGLQDLLDQLRGRFDYVLFDCPPVLGFADALVVTNLADGTLLVVEAGETDRQFVAGSLRQLNSVRAHMLGAVLNGVSSKLNSYYGYYSHSYEYSTEESEHD